MSAKRVGSLSFLMLTLLLAMTACDIGGAPASSSPSPSAGVSVGGATPTAAASPMPLVITATPRPAAPTSAAGATAAATTETRSVQKLSSGLQKLKSYRAQLAIAFDGKDKSSNPQKGSANFLNEVNNESKDQHVKYLTSGDFSGAFGSATGSAASTGVFELYRVSNNTFLVPNGKCQFLGSGDSAVSNAPLFSPDDFIGSMDKAVLINRGETVNGVVADHYQATNTALTGAGLEGMKLAQGDIWIARDDYVVKATGNAAGTTKSGSTGNVTLNYNVDQINALPALVLPGDCVAPVAAADVPLPTNITEKRIVTANGATLTSFKTTDSAKVIGDFFVQQLPPLGWKLDADQANPAGRALQFSKDGGKRTLTINYVGVGGSNNVLLTDKTSK